jgi:rare lipoprotein A (peptidoglycan hydrolase)
MRKLRIINLFAASLLGASPISIATPAKGNNVSGLKPSSIGIASWYGDEHQGMIMANGQRFDSHKLTAASWILPLGTAIRVVNAENGKSVVVTVTDRGPNQRLHRILDLSEAAAARLDYVKQGLAPVFFAPMPYPDPEPSAPSSSLRDPV